MPAQTFSLASWAQSIGSPVNTFDPQRSADGAFIAAVRALPAAAETAPAPATSLLGGAGTLTIGEARELFEAQVTSRHLDFAARDLRAEGVGYYTIGSAGHEGNAAVAAALRPTDPALLHYRSGAFFVARARQHGGVDAVRDVLLGVVAARDEPMAGGRHKVFGSRPLNIPPQTSTIASHLPRALGLALALERRRRVPVDPAAAPCPDDAIVVCTFGDASANHSTAAGTVNAALHTSHQGLPVPLLLVCEDNGLGISVPTPAGWIAKAFGERPGLHYAAADGCDLQHAYETATEAVHYVRTRRRPAFVHLSTVRLLGHAGSDIELAYRSARQIRETEARDPLIQSARLLIEGHAMTRDEVLTTYEQIRRQVDQTAHDVATRRGLRSAAEVMAPITPGDPAEWPVDAARVAPAEQRAALLGETLPEDRGPLTLAESLNAALSDLLARYPEMLVFGEDIGKKGGVYGVTRGLQKKAGVARVFDSLLDEQSILGVALGAGLAGYLPVPEIQYLAYLHNAIDQLRGEASSLSFFSQGAYRNPLVLRIAGYAYQKGFGGHFHNDNAVAPLRDIPGLIIASPALPDDAAAMLRTSVAAAKTGAVVVFLEPIALYHTRDLHEAGDRGWLATYDPQSSTPVGRARVHGEGRDVLLVSFANGLRMSLRAARRLEEEGITARVLDLRWLAPLPMDDIAREARDIGRVLVVDETRKSGGIAEAVIAGLVDSGYDGTMARVTSLDSFVPLGPAADHVLLNEEQVLVAARELVRRG
ncbi:MAG: MFS transporter [Deltaproteobacteria bacterium]|nr:MFS transporter [Deltaproteobacteria bacterium]